MYIGANDYSDYDPAWCDGHECIRDCEHCAYRWENRDTEEYDLDEIIEEVRSW